MTASNINRDAQLSTIANAAYLDKPPETISIGGASWERVLDSSSTPTTSGFFGVAYRNPLTKEIAIAYRGTDGMSDLKADTTFANGGWNQQFTDAAKFTADIKALTIGEGAVYAGAKLLTTGHSLGDGIAQIMSKMFSLDGTGFEGPGATAVVQNAQFAAVKTQYASDTTGQIGSYTTYKASGSAISSVGTHLGGVENLVNLSSGSVLGLLGAMVGIAGLTTGGAVPILLSALGFTATNVADKHRMDGIERAMHVAAGLQNALNDGRQSMVQISVSSATGQPWTGDGAEPQVTAFKNASGQVTAYMQNTGNSWKLSTVDQQTSITLTPSGTRGEPPKCVVNQVGEEPKSCVIDESGGTLTRKIDIRDNGSFDQTTTRNWLAEDVFQTDVFNAGSSLPSSQSLDMGAVSYNLLDAAQNNDASYKLWQLNQDNALSDNAWHSFTEQSSNFLVDYSLGGASSINVGLQIPANWLDPIGAFYDSQSAAFDSATSIADKTLRIVSNTGEALTAAQLAGRDSNADGQLSGLELNGLNAWQDLNEDGLNPAGSELSALSAALASAGVSRIRASDYAFYTQGNGRIGTAAPVEPASPQLTRPTRAGLPSDSAPARPNPSEPVQASLLSAAPSVNFSISVPASNYRTLRGTDNVMRPKYSVNTPMWKEAA